MDIKKKRLKKSNSFNLKNHPEQNKGGLYRIQKFMKKMIHHPNNHDSGKFNYNIQTSRTAAIKSSHAKRNKSISRENRKYLERIMKDRSEKHKQLQRIVHHNYEKFIFTSKEIENFLEEIIEVNHNLNHLKQNISNIYKSIESDGNRFYKLGKSQYDGIDKMRIDNECLDILLELELKICENKFGDAMNMIEEIEKEHDDIRENEEFCKIYESHKENLKKKIIERVFSPLCKRTELMDCIGFLRVLTSDVVARHIFLKSQEQLIQNRISNVFLKGDLLSYIKTITTIKFESIIQVKQEFTRIFKSPSDISAFVKWILATLQDFTELIEVQMFSSNSLSLIASCMECVIENFETLEEEGICIHFKLDELFHENLKKAITKFSMKWKETHIDRSLKNHEPMPFELRAFEELSPICESDSAIIFKKSIRSLITGSGSTLFNILISFTLNVRKMGRSICSTFIDEIGNLLKFYSQKMINFVKHNHYLNQKQYFVILSTFSIIYEKLLPWIEELLSNHYNRRFPEIGNLIDYIKDERILIYNTYIKTKSELLFNELEISKEEYPKIKEKDFSKIKVSKGLTNFVRKFFPVFTKDTKVVRMTNNERKHFFVDLFNNLMNLAKEKSNIKKTRDGENSNFELNKAILDLQFIKRICKETNLNQEIIDFIDNQLIQKMKENNPEFISQSDEWFLEAIEKALKKKRVKRNLEHLKELTEVEKEEIKLKEENS